MKLISFCLYGHYSKYILGLYENLDLAPTIYPGWKVRVYVDKDHYIIPKLRREYPDVEVVQRESNPGSKSMFWRLEAMYDTQFTHVIFRDVDSRLSTREVPLVNEWIASGKDLHVIRDHKLHNLVPMLGGAHGCIPDIKYKAKLERWNHTNLYGDDELFLRNEVYHPTFTLAHSSQSRRYGDEIRIEPSQDYVCKVIAPKFNLKKLYVVNAKRYTQRYTKFLRALEVSEILSNMEVVRVEGSDISSHVLPSWFNQQYPHWWAVTEDHKALLKSLVLNNEDLALIFEDDGLPNIHFDEYFTRMWNAVNTIPHTHPEWTALLLGGQQDDKRQYMTGDYALATGGYGQHSILYNYSGLRGFLDHARYWNYESIDVAFAGYQKQFQNVYCPARWITDISGIQFGRDC